MKIDPESIVINRELRENRTNFHFPVGFEPFTVDTGYNFQMNRSYAMGYARYDDFKFVEEKLNSGSDYQTEMILLNISGFRIMIHSCLQYVLLPQVSLFM